MNKPKEAVCPNCGHLLGCIIEDADVIDKAKADKLAEHLESMIKDNRGIRAEHAQQALAEYRGKNGL